jgi:GntR family transcriptional regulator
VTIDLLGPDPIYRQIAAVLAGRIADGTYAPNRAIPSAAAIAQEFGVARRTANQAVDVLKADGLVRGVRGRGVFVVPQESGETGASDGPAQ